MRDIAAPYAWAGQAAGRFAAAAKQCAPHCDWTLSGNDAQPVINLWLDD